MSLNINVNAGDPILASDMMSVVNQVNANETAISGKLPLTGGTMSGVLNMGGQAITNFRTTQNTDPATRKYVSDSVGTCLLKAGGTMAGALNMGGYKITNLATPTTNTDAVTKAYADAIMPTYYGKDNKTSVTVNLTTIYTNNFSVPVLITGNCNPILENGESTGICGIETSNGIGVLNTFTDTMTFCDGHYTVIVPPTKSIKAYLWHVSSANYYFEIYKFGS